MTQFFQGNRLKTLATKLKSFPHYYVRVIGQATGNTDIDAELAQARAEVVVKQLVQNGIADVRLRAEGQIGALEQQVIFVVGQIPF